MAENSTKYPESKFGEIWTEADGCLLLQVFDVYGTGSWLAFGNATPVREDDAKLIHPLTRIVDQAGNVQVQRLSYPNGTVFSR